MTKLDTSVINKNPLSILVILCITIFSCNNSNNDSGAKYPEPFTPEEALKKFNLDENFSLEIFAAEPYIADPVEMAFDEDGVAYIVEMPDYPFPPKEGEEAGKIKALFDINKDGRIDSSIVFADKLSEATSVMPWKGGLLVTAAPDILFLKDTNGDYKSDIQEILFTGFYKSNSEAQITSLRYSVDNWIYANNRGQAGKITNPDEPNVEPIDMQGADFRFRPDLQKYETETGPGQFGQTINQWGHRFFTENTIHLQQSVIPRRYTHRNDFLKNPRAIINISDHDPIMFQETEAPYWRKARSAARNRNYQAQGLNRVEYEDDHFTGASGGTVYSADAYGNEFQGNIFTGEVAGNLVHRDVLTLDNESPVYKATRAPSDKEREFLASIDPWFRPVGFTVGPDGYLYIIDYYRQHIETPLSIPDSLKVDMDFLRGNDMGRIYRLVPKNNPKPKSDFPKLSSLTAAQLLPYLAHGNQWYRLNAQRLIIDKQDKSVEAELKKLVQTSTNALERLHALYTLEGLNLLDLNIVQAALKDESAGVREHAIMLSENYQQLSGELKSIALNDPSARVVLQATLSAGNISDKSKATDILLEVAESRGNSPWIKTAILSSDVGSSIGFWEKLIQRKTFFNQYEGNKASFAEDFSSIIAARNKPGEVNTVIRWASQDVLQDPKWKSAFIKGIGKVYSTGKIVMPPQVQQQIDAARASGNSLSDTINKYLKVKK